jgi:hypothetical protein
MLGRTATDNSYPGIDDTDASEVKASDPIARSIWLAECASMPAEVQAKAFRSGQNLKSGGAATF